MSKNNFLFTSESVSEGHPDKVCDRISDMVVDSYLSKDPVSRVACETLTTTNKVVLAGETRGPKINKDELINKVRDCIKDIGYDQKGFSWKTANIETHLHEQSTDIAMGVDSKDNKDEGAGDQGIMFGFACKETEDLMPAPIHFSHKILRLMAQDRKEGILKGIEPDSKSQVSMLYENNKPTKVTSVVISTQHSKDLDQEKVRELIVPYIQKSIPKNYIKDLKSEEIYINPTGQFIIGGPDGDTGLTGRKIIVDTYGGAAPHGGGAFSGKDPTKVDRSAAYVARYLAKNIVSSGTSDKCLIQLAYAIGVSKPLSIYVKLEDGDQEKVDKIKKIINENFDLSPRGIREMLKLNNPIYEITSAYGHFGRKPSNKGEFSWEKTDKADLFKLWTWKRRIFLLKIFKLWKFKMGGSPFFFRRTKMLNRGLDKLELLRIVEAVANEKSIDKELVIGSMESAIQKAALTKFGNDNNIEVIIDRDTGEIKIQKVLEVVENLEDSAREITLEAAKKAFPETKEIKLGTKLYEELPQIDFGRIAAQSAKQVISSRVREAEKNRQYDDFIEKQGQILSGIIKRLEYGNVIVDLGKAEGVIKKDELIPREILKTGDRVKAYCYEVKKELKGHQIFLSRAHPQFLAKLFFQEVPEIYEGTIEIKSVARDPGSRAKICVHSQDSSIDPVGACVGMRGSRVQTIVNELHGEKIDIIKWTEDLPTLISESLSPAEIQKVLIDQDNKRIDIILTEENLSKAIGRRGQNVRLASKLTNFEIDILTDKEDSERRQAEFKDRTETLIKNLEVDETLGQLLVSEGFTSIEDIAQSSSEGISKIDAIDEETAKELIKRSKETLIKEKEAVALKLKELGVEEKLVNLKGMTQGMLVILGQKNIKKLSDFADLSSDELIGGFDEIKGKKVRIDGYLEEFSLSRKEADDLIMSAREIVYK